VQVRANRKIAEIYFGENQPYCPANRGAENCQKPGFASTLCNVFRGGPVTAKLPQSSLAHRSRIFRSRLAAAFSRDSASVGDLFSPEIHFTQDQVLLRIEL